MTTLICVGHHLRLRSGIWRKPQLIDILGFTTTAGQWSMRWRQAQLAAAVRLDAPPAVELLRGGLGQYTSVHRRGDLRPARGGGRMVELRPCECLRRHRGSTFTPLAFPAAYDRLAQRHWLTWGSPTSKSPQRSLSAGVLRTPALRDWQVRLSVSPSSTKTRRSAVDRSDVIDAVKDLAPQPDDAWNRAREGAVVALVAPICQA